MSFVIRLGRAFQLYLRFRSIVRFIPTKLLISSILWFLKMASFQVLPFAAYLKKIQTYGFTTFKTKIIPIWQQNQRITLYAHLTIPILYILSFF